MALRLLLWMCCIEKELQCFVHETLFCAWIQQDTDEHHLNIQSIPQKMLAIHAYKCKNMPDSNDPYTWRDLLTNSVGVLIMINIYRCNSWNAYKIPQKMNNCAIMTTKRKKKQRPMGQCRLATGPQSRAIIMFSSSEARPLPAYHKHDQMLAYGGEKVALLSHALRV